MAPKITCGVVMMVNKYVDGNVSKVVIVTIYKVLFSTR